MYDEYHNLHGINLLKCQSKYSLTVSSINRSVVQISHSHLLLSYKKKSPQIIIEEDYRNVEKLFSEARTMGLCSSALLDVRRRNCKRYIDFISNSDYETNKH